MSTQDRDKWIHECFVENYDILVVRARRRAGNDPILRNEIEDCVIEAFEMAWNMISSSIIRASWVGSRKRSTTRLIIFVYAHRRKHLGRRLTLTIRQ